MDLVLAVTTVTVAVTWLTLLGGTLIPLITGIVTKQMAPSGLKSLCTAVLSVLAGVVSTALATDGTIELEPVIMNAMTAFVVAISSYYGFWKPTGVAPSLQESTDTFGIG